MLLRSARTLVPIIVGVTWVVVGCDRDTDQDTSQQEIEFEEFEGSSPDPSVGKREADRPNSESKSARVEVEKTDAGEKERGEPKETAETEIEVLGVEEVDREEGTSNRDSGEASESKTSKIPDNLKIEEGTVEDLEQIQIPQKEIPRKIREMEIPEEFEAGGGPSGDQGEEGGSSP